MTFDPAKVAPLARKLGVPEQPFDEGEREAFEERAAIREFDAGMTRDDAESHALADVLLRRRGQ